MICIKRQLFKFRATKKDISENIYFHSELMRIDLNFLPVNKKVKKVDNIIGQRVQIELLLHSFASN